MFHRGTPLPGYPFNVYEVEKCPTIERWNRTAHSLNCRFDNTNTHRYHCLPNSNLTKLLQFCWNQTRYGTGEVDGAFDCYRLTGEGTGTASLLRTPCSNVSNSCPDKFYYSDQIYQYPDCFHLNKTSERFGARQQSSDDIANIIIPCVTSAVFLIVLGLVLLFYCKRRNRKKGVKEEIPLLEPPVNGTSTHSQGQWTVPLGATSAKIINPVQRCITINSKDTVFLLAEIRSIVEVQSIAWQKRTGNGEWENLDISQEKYKGSRDGLHVPCLIINDCRSDGFYRLVVENTDGPVHSKERQICVNRDENVGILNWKIDVLKGIAQSLILLTFRNFVCCKKPGKFVDFVTTAMPSFKENLDEEENMELKKVLDQALEIENLSLGFLYKIIHFLGIPSPANGWGNEPKEGSKTEADDLERCHQYWNHIRGSNKSPSDLCYMWKSLSQAMHRLNRKFKEINPLIRAFRKMVFWTMTDYSSTGSMPENISDQNRAQIDGWIDDDLLYDETRASTNTTNFIKTTPVTVLIGGPASGKSFLARHIALEYQLNGWDFIPISSPEEIRKYGDIKKKQIFVQDDAFGVYGINQAAVNAFQQFYSAVQNVLRDGSKYIITCRKTIFLAAQISSFFDKFVDIDSDKNRLSTEEKKSILRCHCEEKMVDKALYQSIVPPSKAFMFPLLCHLFASNPQNTASYFENPCKQLLKEFNKMYERDCKRLDYTALVLCAVNNGSISMKSFPTDDVRKDILESCGCNLGTSKREILDSLNRMVGTYTSRVGEHISFIHDAIGEVTVCHFGKENLKQVLDLFSITYIVNNVKFDVKSDDDLKLILGEDHYDKLAVRLMQDIECGKLYEVFMSEMFNHEKFRSHFVDKIKGIDTAKFRTTFIERKPENEYFKEKIDHEISGIGEHHKMPESHKHFLLQDISCENQGESRSIKAISWLVYYAHPDILKAVIDREKSIGGSLDLLLGSSSEEHSRLLVLACYRGSKTILDLLLPHCLDGCLNMYPLKSNLHDSNNFHRFHTPLTAAISCDEDDFTLTLLKLGTTVNTRDGWGNTPLIAAVRAYRLGTIQALIEQFHADINLESTEKESALYIASEQGHTDIVKYLCSKGAESKESTKSPLRVAGLKKHYSILEMLKEHEKSS